MLLACACACGPAANSNEPTVVAEDARYRVLARTSSPSSATSSGELRVEVQTSGGWHIAPEAPARLDLTARGVTLASTELREEDKQSADEDGFVFATELRASAPGRHAVLGTLKFGICEGPKEKCVIVRRDLSIPVDVAFTD
jgi:hypothetical protein